MSTINKLFKGSMLRLFALFTNIVAVFLLLPFILRSLGDELYGLWSLVAVLTGYYFILDLGIGQSINRYVAFNIKNDKNIKKFVSNGLFIFLIIGLIVIILSIILSFAIRYFVSPTLYPLVRILVIIVGIEVGMTLALRTYEAVLKSYLDFHLISIIEILKIIVRSLSIYYVLSIGYGIISMAIVNSFFNVSSFAAMAIVVFKKYPNIRFARDYVNVKCIKDLLNFSKYVFLVQMAEDLKLRVAPFIIASMLTLCHVTIFSIVARIIGYFKQLVRSIIGVAGPVFTHSAGSEDYETIRKNFLLISRISIYIGSFIGGSLILFGDDFIFSWLGIEYVGTTYPILFVLTIALTIVISQEMGFEVVQSINKHRQFAYIRWYELALNFFMNLILIPFFGLIGAAYAIAFPLILFQFIIQPFIVIRKINLTRSELFNQILPPMFSILIFFTICYVVIRFIQNDYFSYFYITISLVPIAVIYGLYLYTFLLSVEEKKILWRLTSGIFSKHFSWLK